MFIDDIASKLLNRAAIGNVERVRRNPTACCLDERSRFFQAPFIHVGDRDTRDSLASHANSKSSSDPRRRTRDNSYTFAR
jgi:hypothetical protein